MTIPWLPYGGAAPASPPRRPPAFSLRPAVVLPLAVAAVLVLTTTWAVAATPLPTPVLPPVSAPIPAQAASQLSSVFTESVQAWSPSISGWAEMYDLPAHLVAVVMTLESCGDADARSRAGALGLFQVMPFHFASAEDPLDPETNAHRGLAYLRRSLDLSGGDMARALAGYNGGLGMIDRDPSGWPAETQRYVMWGTGILGDLAAGSSPSPTLQAWLAAGGARLCGAGVAA